MFIFPVCWDVHFPLIPGCSGIVFYGREPERKFIIFIAAVRCIFFLLQEQFASFTDPLNTHGWLIAISLRLHAAGQFYRVFQLLAVPLLIRSFILSIQLKMPLACQRKLLLRM